MVDQIRLKELRASLANNPGGEEFVELAQLLAEDESTRSEARDVCFRGIQANPRHLIGRLLLARLFYLDGLGEFCVRELIELTKYCDAPSVQKLLEGFGDYAKPFLEASRGETASEMVPSTASKQHSGERVVAEVDLDIDFTETLDELEALDELGEENER